MSKIFAIFELINLVADKIGAILKLRRDLKNRKEFIENKYDELYKKVYEIIKDKEVKNNTIKLTPEELKEINKILEE